MKKIAIITSGLLPMPAVKGGAIETLLQYFIDYNEDYNSYHLEIYSIENEDALHASKKYKKSKFYYISLSQFKTNLYYNFCRVRRKLGYRDPNFQKLYIDEVCKKLKNKNYDLILIESDNHFVIPIGQITKTPIILYLHNDKLNVNTKNCKKILGCCKGVITVSEYIKKQVLTIDKYAESKVTTILNGIDTHRFHIKGQEKIRTNLRKKYGFQAGDFVFLFTGRIEPNKGVLELVKAFNFIKNDHAKLLILGGSFFSSNKKTKYTEKIEFEISNHKNIIITGYIDHYDIPKYHAMCDCMVSPSQWDEPGSLVNQEAFASGLPLISSDSGGTPEYTKNTKAILIQRGPQFINELSNSLNHLINNKKLQQDMRESQLKVSPYFSKERYCEDLKQYLDKVV